MDHSGHAGGGSGFLRGRSGLVLLAFLAIGAFLLLSEHRAHLLGFLPWLLLLAVPLLHVFMHGGHGSHGSGESGGGGDENHADQPGGNAGPAPHRH